MNCRACGHENRSEARFCEGCGAPHVELKGLTGRHAVYALRV